MDPFNFIFFLSHPVCRHFNLRMKRDTSLFSEEFRVETSNAVLDYDTSHIYTGHIYGKLNLKELWFFSTQENLCFLKCRQIFQKDGVNPGQIWLYHEEQWSLKDEVILGSTFTYIFSIELCSAWLLKGMKFWFFDYLQTATYF